MSWRTKAGDKKSRRIRRYGKKHRFFTGKKQGGLRISFHEQKEDPVFVLLNPICSLEEALQMNPDRFVGEKEKFDQHFAFAVIRIGHDVAKMRKIRQREGIFDVVHRFSFDFETPGEKVFDPQGQLLAGRILPTRTLPFTCIGFRHIGFLRKGTSGHGSILLQLLV